MYVPIFKICFQDEVPFDVYFLFCSNFQTKGYNLKLVKIEYNSIIKIKRIM